MARPNRGFHEHDAGGPWEITTRCAWVARPAALCPPTRLSGYRSAVCRAGAQRCEEHPFVDHHGKEALNFTLSLLLYGRSAWSSPFITVGIGLLVFLPGVLVFLVLWVWATIQAAIKASRGEGFRHPLAIRFIQG